MGLIGGSHDKLPGDEEGRNMRHERLDLDAMRVPAAALRRAMTPQERRRLDAEEEVGSSEPAPGDGSSG